MKESRLHIDQSCRGTRLARIPIVDVLRNDAVVEHFSGLKLERAAEAMVAAAGAERRAIWEPTAPLSYSIATTS